MLRQRPIELLAPAKNLECGMEAINHGADAVYIEILWKTLKPWCVTHICIGCVFT